MNINIQIKRRYLNINIHLTRVICYLSHDCIVTKSQRYINHLNILGSIIPGEVTECRQQRATHKLVTLDPDTGDLVVDEFEFPSCCTCHVLDY